jgi:hypothetical protein
MPYHNVHLGDARILGFLGVISVRIVVAGGLTCDIDSERLILNATKLIAAIIVIA